MAKKEYCLRMGQMKQITELLPKANRQDFRSFTNYIADGPSQSTLLDSLKPYIGKQRILCQFRYFEIGETAKLTPYQFGELIKKEEGFIPLEVRITGLVLAYLGEFIEGHWMFTAQVVSGNLKDKIIMGAFHPHYRHGGFEILS